MKRSLLFLAALSLALPALAGEPIGIVVNNNTNSFHLINPLTLEVTPSLCKGNLGSYGGGLFDVAFTPNGRVVFISNFGDSRVYAVDISGGFAAEPTVLGYVDIPFFAEDMDVTPDGKYLLVTDGGFTSRLATVNLATLKVTNNNLHGNSANAVAIHPSGKYVYMADYFGAMIHAYVLNEDGTVTYKQTVWTGTARPVNLTVSPDGQTLITVNAGSYKAYYMRISSTGGLTEMDTLQLPTKSGQSCVFSADGTKAYYYSNSQLGKFPIHVLDITAPGKVAYNSSIVMSIPRGTSQLFGVDTLAIDPSGKYLFATNPTVSGGAVEVTVINLATQTEAAQLHCNGIPTGIAFTTIE